MRQNLIKDIDTHHYTGGSKIKLLKKILKHIKYHLYQFDALISEK